MSCVKELNGHLQLSGWDDFELDNYTLQLILTTFDPDPAACRPETVKGSSIVRRNRRVKGEEMNKSMNMELAQRMGRRTEKVDPTPSLLSALMVPL